MPLTIDPISSLGTRDITLSLADALETGETLASVSVDSSNDAVLGVSNVAINTVAVLEGDVSAAIGQAVHFSITGLLTGTCWSGSLWVDYTGSSGSKDCYELEVDVLPKLTA